MRIKINPPKSSTTNSGEAAGTATKPPMRHIHSLEARPRNSRRPSGRKQVLESPHRLAFANQTGASPAPGHRDALHTKVISIDQNCPAGQLPGGNLAGARHKPRGLQMIFRCAARAPARSRTSGRSGRSSAGSPAESTPARWREPSPHPQRSSLRGPHRAGSGCFPVCPPRSRL